MFISSNPRLMNKLQQTTSVSNNLNKVDGKYASSEQSNSPAKQHGTGILMAKNAPAGNKFALVNRAAVSTNQLPNVVPAHITTSPNSSKIISQSMSTSNFIKATNEIQENKQGKISAQRKLNIKSSKTGTKRNETPTSNDR